MAFLEDKQLKKDLLALFVLVAICSFISGFSIFYGLNVEFVHFAGKLFFMVIAVSFLFVDLVLFKTLARRLS